MWEAIDFSFAKNIGKNLSSKYSQKLLYSANESTRATIKTTSKRAIPKIAEVAGNLIGNHIVFKDIWEWFINNKRKIYISKKRTKNSWWINISIII